jgi:hypothetical protein
VEIVFPLEFVVPGTPVSLQAKRAGSGEAWKNRSGLRQCMLSQNRDQSVRGETD